MRTSVVAESLCLFAWWLASVVSAQVISVVTFEFQSHRWGRLDAAAGAWSPIAVGIQGVTSVSFNSKFGHVLNISVRVTASPPINATQQHKLAATWFVDVTVVCLRNVFCL